MISNARKESQPRKYASKKTLKHNNVVSTSSISNKKIMSRIMLNHINTLHWKQLLVYIVTQHKHRIYYQLYSNVQNNDNTGFC